MTAARALSRILACAAMLAIAGCAPPPAGQGAAAAPPAAATPGAKPSSGAPKQEPVATAATNDSTPSADAERVLATIPEPLSPSQQVSPPAGTGTTIVARAPEAAYDTLRAQGTSGGDSAAIPVPAPTQPLGSSPTDTLSMPETLTAPAAGATGAATAPVTETSPATDATGAPTGTTTAPADTTACWRVQVAAPDAKEMADSRSEAAQSLLLVPMTITFEKGLYKVRTRDCLARDAADALKQRAEESGFTGAFLLNTSAPAATSAPPAAKPKSKPKSSKSSSTKHTSHTTGSTKPK
jgi:hypothetical protein